MESRWYFTTLPVHLVHVKNKHTHHNEHHNEGDRRENEMKLLSLQLPKNMEYGTYHFIVVSK